MTIETKRLLLRPVIKKDEEDLAKALNNINISKWIVPMPHPYKKKDAEWWINNQIKKRKEKPRIDYHFAIELKPNKRLIGVIGIFGFDKYKIKGELGYWLDQKYWKQGIMSEAIEKIIEFSFSKLKLKKINLPIFAKNNSSNALAKKFGFKLEGKLRKNARCQATNKIHDENVWGLLKKEWPKIKKGLKK